MSFDRKNRQFSLKRTFPHRIIQYFPFFLSAPLQPLAPPSRSRAETDSLRKSRFRSSSQTNINHQDRDRDHRSTIGAPLKRASSATNLTPNNRATIAPGSMSSSKRTTSAVRSSSATRPSMPASVGRHSMAPNADQNRKIITEKANRVIEILQKYENEFENRLNLASALKSMTARQFVDIIQFFRHKITGKSLLTHDRQSNPEAELLAFIQKMSYPTAVAKSWFKTPTAPHAYAECVTLLAWLADFVPDLDENVVDDDWEIEGDTDFSDVDYTRIFSAGVQHAFPLWSKGDDEEFDAITKELIDANIVLQMEHRINNAAELIQFTDDLRQSSEKLMADHATELSAPPMDVHIYDIKLNEIQTKLRVAHEQRTLAIERFERTTKKNCDTTGKFAAKKAQLTELNQKIQSQTYTSLDIKQQIAMESSLKQRKTMLAEDLASARDINSGRQIATARMIKKFDDAVAGFKGLLVKCERLITKFDERIRDEIQIPRLDPANVSGTIMRAIDGLNKITNVIERHHRELQLQCDEQQILHERLESELKHLRENVDRQTIHASQVKTMLSDASKAHGELMSKYGLFQLQYLESTKQAGLIYLQLGDEKVWTQNEIEKMTKENAILFETKRKEHLQIIQARRERIARIQDVCKALDEFI